jgi:hypothetical protein
VGGTYATWGGAGDGGCRLRAIGGRPVGARELASTGGIGQAALPRGGKVGREAAP